MILMENKSELHEIALLRVLATFSIVVWHIYCCYLGDILECPADGVYSKIFVRVFPDANMPLFTFIAGYLFCFLLKEKGKYQRFKEFLINKTHRLLIPFLVLGAVINLCEYGKDIVDLLYGTPNHLWYCLMLFYVFIVAWLVQRYLNGTGKLIFLLLSFFVASYDVRTPIYVRVPLGLYLPLFYYGFFYAGMLFREKFEERILKSKLAIGLIFCGYVVLCAFYSKHLIVPLAITQVILLFSISKWFCNLQFYRNNGRVRKVIDVFSKYSFGIYVFHQWIIWNLTREPHLLSYVKPILESHYVCAPVALSIFIFLLCFLITHVVQKTKVGRYLLF